MELIAHNTTARVFSCGYNDRYHYPYRLQNAKNARRSGRECCYELMLDSGFNNPELTNEDVIETAIDLNADYIMPKDVLGDAEATRESLEGFLDIYEERSDCHARVFVILQPPYLEHYRAHEEFYSQFTHFALGGLHDYPPAEQVTMLREFAQSDAVSDHTYIHALGIGTDLEIIRFLRQNPRVVDSIDVSTAETAIANGKIPDSMWDQTPFYLPRGVDRSSLQARFSCAILMMLNYVLGEKVDSDEFAEGASLGTAYREQTVLGDISSD